MLTSTVSRPGAKSASGRGHSVFFFFFFSRREILSDWSPIHKICLKFALYVFVHMVCVTLPYTVISTVRDWHTRVGLVVTVSGLYAADLCVPCTWFRGSLC